MTAWKPENLSFVFVSSNKNTFALLSVYTLFGTTWYKDAIQLYIICLVDKRNIHNFAKSVKLSLK